MILIEIAFLWCVAMGTVIPNGDNDGRHLYELYDSDCNIISENAYKGEILEYLQTGTFEYNEDLADEYPYEEMFVIEKGE